MGSLRIFLALIVVARHVAPSHQLPMIGADLAVRLFFIISGFYMALILSGKYVVDGKPKLGLFYGNRALRIFPMLWLTLIAELILAFLANSFGLQWSKWSDAMRDLRSSGHSPLIAMYLTSQVSGFGVDFAHLFSISERGDLFAYTGSIHAGEWRGWQPYPMPHAWTISCELMFYLLVPYLNQLSAWRLIGFLMIPLLVLQGALAHVLPRPLADVVSGFWWPMQLWYFILGILSYRLYKSGRVDSSKLRRLLGHCVILVFALCVMMHDLLSKVSYAGSLALLYLTALLVLPVIFTRSSGVKWDRTLGELSYPVYLIHLTVIHLFLCLSQKGYLGGLMDSLSGSVLVAGCSLVIAWLMVVTVDRPADKLRQRRIACRNAQA